MINQQRLRKSRLKNKARNIPVTAPVGGWNTRDALNAMPKQDAINLDNWFPGLGSCEVRPGYAEHATGLGSGDVSSIFSFRDGATKKLIGCANGNIYDATSSGAASSLGSGYSNNVWQGTNFLGYLVINNGADTGVTYDGTTLAAQSWSGSGYTAANILASYSHKHRLYQIENDSLDFWYGGVNGISGTMTKFPLSRVTQLGGKIICFVSWTLDNGSGIDDLAVFITSTGQAVVYSGSDPGDATDWSLVGVFDIGEPMNIRGITRSAGDAIITTVSDYVSMSEVLRTGQIGTASKLSGAVTAAATQRDTDGWSSVVWRKGNMIVFNVPMAGGTFDQHVINTITGAPTRFKGIPARSWAVYETDLYFGAGDGKIYKMTGTTDDGTSIQADGETAWNDIGSATRKRLCAHRPTLKTSGSIAYEVGTGFDFQSATVPPATSTAAIDSLWDVALWDVALWSSGQQVDLNWKIAQGTGQNFSTRLRVNATGAVLWMRTEYRIETGSNL